MALYAIGDIQGCHAEFCELLDLIGFDAARDRLWLVGDLVNRGPGSLAVLRDVMALGDAATTVLGNHDFHLLTIAAGHRKPHRGDTLDDILAAPDRDELVAWLTARPLVAVEATTLMVHAGFCRRGRRRRRSRCRAKCEAMLASDRAREFLGVLYGDEPRQWRDDLDGYDRLRVDRQRMHAAALLHRRRHDGADGKARTSTHARRLRARGSSIPRRTAGIVRRRAATGRRSTSC